MAPSLRTAHRRPDAHVEAAGHRNMAVTTKRTASLRPSGIAARHEG